ncbi:MAG: hypothetical protein CMM01_21210 [Rhodopirellula sp.]|nr:hypothetical protein [Rhodopirellula sp.]OUX49580.1 MAG: hypothetical protein CBE43_09705 [Rhodopirellula sp. TMED283]
MAVTTRDSVSLPFRKKNADDCHVELQKNPKEYEVAAIPNDEPSLIRGCKGIESPHKDIHDSLQLRA